MMMHLQILKTKKRILYFCNKILQKFVIVSAYKLFQAKVAKKLILFLFVSVCSFDFLM